MSETVIDFRSRRPASEIEAEKQQRKSEREAVQQQGMLDAWDQIRQLFERGQLDSFVLVARGKQGAFLTEVAMPALAGIDIVSSYAGAIAAVHLELLDIVQDMPQMLNDGTIVAPEEIAERLE